jgi:ABC-type lipoprotein export system ATPase subunit
LDEYIRRINRADPPAVALGVTDYLSVRGYKVLRERWLTGDLPGIRFLFPNIEFRVSPPTKSHKGVNFHLLVDPSGNDHAERIENALARLPFTYRGEVFNCNQSGLTRLGRTIDPDQDDDEAAYSQGVKEFKLDFSVLRDWFREDAWLREHCLVAVTNRDHDGVSGLSKEHGYAAVMEEMYRFAAVVLSGNPKDRSYWLGEGTDDTETLTRRFGGTKPCLHGCDAHNLDRVLAPDGDRFCWIRAEPTFEGLRQVVFEAKERVHIGPDRPARARNNWIRSVTAVAPWFPAHPIEVNSGLVAVIGPRGSGKTALADLLAHGADAFDNGPASFLKKAMPIASGTEVSLAWADRDSPETRLVGEQPEEHAYPAVRYLSQHFVEQLCSSDGASDRLIDEIEHVVFYALDETDRLGASSFSELRNMVTEGSTDRIQALRAEIAECSQKIAREHAAKADLPTKRQRLKKLASELADIAKGITRLLVKGKEVKIKALEALRDELSRLEEVVTDLKSNHRRLTELRLDLEQRERLAAEYYEELREELLRLGVAKADLSVFREGFGGDFRAVLTNRCASISKDIASRSEGTEVIPGFSGTLAILRNKIEELQKEIGVDAAKEKQLVELQRTERAKQRERTGLESEIKRAECADNTIKAAFGKRLERYSDVFVEFAWQREQLGLLYKPLGDLLAEAPPERRKLEFSVLQLVDIGAWAERGEQLLDLRRKGEFFRESGSLARKAEEILGEAWRSGEPVRINDGMATFLAHFKDASTHLVPSATLAQFADWVFSTDHIRIAYGIRYEGTDIERLSPGTRGIVLLILYLALDTQDDRPIILDQPEENLDPQSVFDVLTGYFREIRGRRQVLVVTHNPNLVVNTDADQVIIASSERITGDTLPHFSYESGGLENPSIRKRVCQVLEGGERAFLERERRYRLQSS